MSTDPVSAPSPLADAAPLKIHTLEAGGERQWDAYVAQHSQATLYHLSGWRELIHSVFGHESLYLYATRGATVAGILPLIRLNSRLFGDFMVSMPYVNYGGVVADSDVVATALMQRTAELAAEVGVGHIEFRDTQYRGDRYPVRTDKLVMELALPKSAEELWSSFDAKLRAQAKRATKEPVEVVIGGKELLSGFYRVFARNMRDLGTPVYGREFFGAVMDAFGVSARIVEVRYRGAPVAAGLLLGYKGRLEIPWASSIREYNRYGVNMLMYWEVLQMAIREDYRVFDFGRSTPNSGTHRFKKQWGAKEKQLYWHYWVRPGRAMPNLTPHNPKYQLAIKLWQRLPLFVANRLGPLLVKSLP